MSMNQTHTEQTEEILLREYEAEQRAFENHKVWSMLGETPQEFFSKLSERIQLSSFDPEKIEHLKKELHQQNESRIREKLGLYIHANHNLRRGVAI